MERAHPEHEFLEQKCTKCSRSIAAELYQEHLDNHCLTTPNKVKKLKIVSETTSALAKPDTRNRYILIVLISNCLNHKK